MLKDHLLGALYTDNIIESVFSQDPAFSKVNLTFS